MKLEVYSVFDSKVGSYARPFFMRTKGEALRAWSKVCNDSSTEIYEHPEDFTLFQLGYFYEETGLFECLPTPNPLGKALEFRKEDTVSSVVQRAMKGSVEPRVNADH